MSAGGQARFSPRNGPPAGRPETKGSPLDNLARVTTTDLRRLVLGRKRCCAGTPKCDRRHSLYLPLSRSSEATTHEANQGQGAAEEASGGAAGGPGWLPGGQGPSLWVLIQPSLALFPETESHVATRKQRQSRASAAKRDLTLSGAPASSFWGDLPPDR